MKYSLQEMRNNRFDRKNTCMIERAMRKDRKNVITGLGNILKCVWQRISSQLFLSSVKQETQEMLEK